MTVLRPMDPLTWRTVVARCLLGSTVKLVAYTLANYASPDGRDVRPGVALLMKDCELGDRTVRDALAKLREVGLVERTFEASLTGLRDKADEYRLTVPDDLAELERRVAMWDPKRQKVTKGGEPASAPVPKKRRKRSQAPATDAGGSTPGNRTEESESDEPPATHADGSTSENSSDSTKTGSESATEDDHHRQLLPEPPATVTGTTGNTCRPPSHAPSHAPSQDTLISPYGAEVEVGSAGAHDEIDLDREYSAAFKVIQRLGGAVAHYVEAIHADAARDGHDPPEGRRLTIAVAALALIDHPDLLKPGRRTA